MMEKQYDLFSIKTRQGFPIWDILRHYVWNNINADDNNVSLPKKTKNYPRKITALFTFSKYLVIILCSLRKSSDILFIGFSRSKNEQQKLQDNYFILLQQFLPASINFFFYEVFINKSNYDNTKRVFDIIYYINKLYRKKIVEFEVLNDIKNKVDKTFGKDKISIVDLEKTLNNFYIEYKLFYFLLKIKKIKCVFLVSSFKGLCFAAKKLKIETFELQHGDIMQTTIHYNYSKELNRIESNCFIFPDILFTYSNYWIKDNNLFSRCIELGKFKFHSEKRLNICKHDIVVVSSPSHYHILKNLTIDLAVCHPQMCNNELSGPVVLTALANYISSQKSLKYTYRFILIPETIGSIAYLSKNVVELKKNVIAGFNLTCLGDNGEFSYIPSRLGNTLSDKVALNFLKSNFPDFISYTWLDRGSDERQYCAPGIDLPICSITRTKYGKYPEYHSSLDDFNVINENALQKSLMLYKELINILETDCYPCLNVLCEPQLGKRGLYPNISTVNSGVSVRDLMNFISYCDGNHSLVDISNKLNLDYIKCQEFHSKLFKANLLK